MGYSPWGRKESDTAERLTFSHLAGSSLETMLYSPLPGTDLVSSL